MAKDVFSAKAYFSASEAGQLLGEDVSFILHLGTTEKLRLHATLDESLVLLPMMVVVPPALLDRRGHLADLLLRGYVSCRLGVMAAVSSDLARRLELKPTARTSGFPSCLQYSNGQYISPDVGGALSVDGIAVRTLGYCPFYMSDLPSLCVDHLEVMSEPPTDGLVALGFAKAAASVEVARGDIYVFADELQKYQQTLATEVKYASITTGALKGAEGWRAKKDEAKALACQLAQVAWARDQDLRLRLADMAEKIRPLLEEKYPPTGDKRKDIIPQPEALKDWIRDVAPAYACQGGRPTKKN